MWDILKLLLLVSYVISYKMEFTCGSSSLELLLHKQHTFEANATVGKVTSELQKDGYGCKFVQKRRTALQQDKIVLADNSVLCDQLHVPVEYSCAYDIVGVQQFAPLIPPEERAKFVEYQRYRKANNNPRAEKEYPFTAAEIVTENLGGSVNGDLDHFLEHHFGPIHPFLTYTGENTGIYSMQTGEQKVKGKQLVHDKYDYTPIRMSMTANFGTGTREAAYVSELMVKDFDPHFTLHNGGIYSVGDAQEVSSNMLGIPPSNTKYAVKFPIGSMGAFALNGNHEMYSRGYGYFDELLPQLGMVDRTTGKPSGQGASYSALENAYWRIINLDTGYNTYMEKGIESNNNSQPQAVIDWLRDEVKIGDVSDSRGIILVSHHHFFSAFDRDIPSIATPSQIAALLPANRTILWLWGHEHQFAFYEQTWNQSGININVFGRSVGNGGFPSLADQQPVRSRETRLKAYDHRVYDIDLGFIDNRLSEVGLGYEKVQIGFNGWICMNFQSHDLAIEYRSLMLDATGGLSNNQSTLLVVENFAVDSKGNVAQTKFEVKDRRIVDVNHV